MIIITQKYYIYFLICLYIIILLIPKNNIAQQPNNNQQIIEDIIENIAQKQNRQIDYTEISDNLFYFINNPININYTNYETLEKLVFLNAFQIKNLLFYIKKHNGLVTLYELQLIEGFDNSTIKNILPFITIEPNNKSEKWKLNNALKYGKHTLYSRISSILETPKGFQTSDSSIKQGYYLGNRLHIYNRYKFNYKNKLQWGITTDKDPGETLFNNKQPIGIDFYSIHIQINDIGIIKKVILGDYQVCLGQGLLMWSQMNLGKSIYVLNVKKVGYGINRYTSSNENAYLRGSALTINKNNFDFTGFVSYKKIDARLAINDTIINDYIFTSFIKTGLHNTSSNMRNNKSVTETLFGGNINWNYKNIRIGLSGIRYFFDKEYIPANTPINKFKFNGKSNSNISTDFDINFNSINIFGEFAISENTGKAILTGMLMELTPQISTSVLYRNYEKNYQSLYSNAFSEGANSQNEQGFYMGIILNPIKNWKISGYYDFYKFPWLKMQTNTSSKGDDYLIQIDFTPSQDFNMYLRYKKETSDMGLNNYFIDKLSSVSKYYLRYNISYYISSKWNFRNRIELSGFNNNDNETGYLLYQDIIYHSSKPISIVFRYAIFDTESYNTRIYTYENDILNVFSIPSFFYKGTRVYIMSRYNVTDKLSLWLRFAQTKYNNKDEIGTGLNLINGNTKTDVKFSVRYKF